MHWFSALGWGPDDIYYYDMWGLFGGFLAELAKWWPKRDKVITELRGIESISWYVVITLLMIFVGGAFVHLYAKSGIDFEEVLAVNIGATAPLLLGLLTSKTPDLRPRDEDP